MLRFPDDFARITRDREPSGTEHRDLFTRLIGQWWLYEPALGAFGYQTYEDYDHDPSDWEMNLYLAAEHYRGTFTRDADPKPANDLDPPCTDALPDVPIQLRTGAGAVHTTDEEVARRVRTVCEGTDEEGYYYVRGGNSIVVGLCDGSREITVLVFRGGLHATLYPPEEE